MSDIRPGQERDLSLYIISSFAVNYQESLLTPKLLIPDNAKLRPVWCWGVIMAMKKGGECCGDSCSMHLCKQCAMPNVIFGLLFLILGFGVWTGAPSWFNFSTLVGLYLALWGLMSMMGKN
jgi:hypothetical protein